MPLSRARSAWMIEYSCMGPAHRLSRLAAGSAPRQKGGPASEPYRPERLAALLARFELPTWADEAVLASPQRFVRTMALDKKVREGRIRLVLLKALGRVEVTADYADEALSALLGRPASGLG